MSEYQQYQDTAEDDAEFNEEEEEPEGDACACGGGGGGGGGGGHLFYRRM